METRWSQKKGDMAVQLPRISLALFTCTPCTEQLLHLLFSKYTTTIFLGILESTNLEKTAHNEFN